MFCELSLCYHYFHLGYDISGPLSQSFSQFCLHDFVKGVEVWRDFKKFLILYVTMMSVLLTSFHISLRSVIWTQRTWELMTGNNLEMPVLYQTQQTQLPECTTLSPDRRRHVWIIPSNLNHHPPIQDAESLLMPCTNLRGALSTLRLWKNKQAIATTQMLKRHMVMKVPLAIFVPASCVSWLVSAWRWPWWQLYWWCSFGLVCMTPPLPSVQLNPLLQLGLIQEPVHVLVSMFIHAPDNLVFL